MGWLTASDLFRRLGELGIQSQTRTHPPVYTVEEAKRLRGEVPGWHVKNLFLRDKKGSMWLLSAPESRKVDLKRLARLLGARGRLSFGSEERMRKYLGVTAGAVTPFAVVNDPHNAVQVVLDRALLDGAPVSFHPLDNTMTTTLASADLLRFLDAEDHRPLVIALEETDPRREVNAVRLAIWEEEKGRTRAAELRESGWPAVYEPLDAGDLLRVLKKRPPGALVIDLSSRPATGRDLGVALRVHKGTRGVPLVFVGGAEAAVAQARSLLPDAESVPWDAVQGALERAILSPPVTPVVPESALAGYAGTPLPKKLGIKQGSRVLLAGAPDGFEESLGGLPEGVRFLRRYSPGVGLVLWFVRSRRELERGVTTWAQRVGREGIWILWPKKSSGLSSDLSQAVVRSAGLGAGLVDYKVAAVDAIWSGLKFARRR